MQDLATQVRRRLDRAVVGRLTQAAVAAGIAWELARQIPGHTQPFFAPIAALIALGAEPGRRGLQALRLLAGVTLGIVVGAVVVALVGRGPLQIVLAAGLSLLLATAAGSSAITSTQAGISAVLVIALHRAGSDLALQRLIDSLVGGALAILIAQILFPIDPLALVRRESQHLRDDLAAALESIAVALSRHDRERAVAALDRIDSMNTQRFDEALALARGVARRAPRRRHARRRLDPLNPLAAALDAAVSDARGVATGALRILGTERPAPPDAARSLYALAEALRAVEPAPVREAVGRAREAARAARAADDSLGVAVLTHAALSIGDQLDRVAAAREEQRR
jgi:Fusaric acid resistance protein-like